jgi:hypothetical protein
MTNYLKNKINNNKMIERKYYFWTLLLLISMSIMYASQVSAAGLSINKAAIDFKNVLKGGYAEDIIYVASDTDMDVPLAYQTMGDIAGWISFDPDINKTNATIYVSRDHIQPLKIIIQPPPDIPSANYSGRVRIMTGTLNRPGGPYGSQLQAAFFIMIKVEVVGTQVLGCDMGGLSIPDTEIGMPLEFSLTVSNTGNIRIRPNASVDFWNQDQTKMIMTKVADFGNIEILPTTARTATQRFDNNLRIGQYWAYVTLGPCDKSELISFSVVEKGAIVDTGELLRIENKPWASIGDIVPVTAYFRNSGSRTVSAKLKGVITLGNRIMENIDSDYYDVAPGELTNITVYFTPKKLGQYYISGRILYNNKLSFEKSSILNVNSGVEQAEINWLYIVLIVIIVIVIIVLLFKIRRKKQAIYHKRI